MLKKTFTVAALLIAYVPFMLPAAAQTTSQDRLYLNQVVEGLVSQGLPRDEAEELIHKRAPASSITAGRSLCNRARLGVSPKTFGRDFLANEGYSEFNVALVISLAAAALQSYCPQYLYMMDQ